MATPKTLRKPAANTASHSSGRTSAETRRPVCCENFSSSRSTMARSACSACGRPRGAGGGGFGVQRGACTASPARRGRACRARWSGAAGLDGACDHALAVGQQQGLAQLAVPGRKFIATPWSRRPGSSRSPRPRNGGRPLAQATAAVASALPAIQAAQSCAVIARWSPWRSGATPAARRSARTARARPAPPGRRRPPPGAAASVR